MTRYSLEKRVARLEARIRPAEPPPELTAEEIRFNQAVAELLGRMDPRFSCHVLSEENRDSNLAWAVGFIALHHIEDGTPLELPAPAAEIYLAYPDAFPRQQCQECGFLSPFTWASDERISNTTDATNSLAPYLETCPLCGGEIGWPSVFTYNQNQASLKSAAPATG